MGCYIFLGGRTDGQTQTPPLPGRSDMARSPSPSAQSFWKLSMENQASRRALMGLLTRPNAPRIVPGFAD